MFNFENFNKIYKEYYPKNVLPSIDFLCWFIGFSEFKCTFSIRKKREEIIFILRSVNSSIILFNYIKNNFKFGNISKVNGKKTGNISYIIYNIKDIYLICLLLNDNPVILPFYEKFYKIFDQLNRRFESLINVKLVSKSILFFELNNYWLNGFLDGNVIFSINYNVFPNRYYLKILNLKHIDLNLIKNWINILEKELKITWEYNKIEDVLNLYSVDWCNLLDYLEKYNLKFEKKKSYLEWKNLLLSKKKNMDNLFSSRDFNFSKFFEEYMSIYPKKKLPSKSFLEWFIGFAEGDGSFILGKRSHLQFVITQSTEDVSILNEIKNNLNIGTVTVQSKVAKTHRYTIQNETDNYLIIVLFNGNLVLPTNLTRFNLFISKYNLLVLKKNKYPEIPIFSCIRLNLNNYWLCGFIDAEGCFFARNNIGKSMSIGFSIGQKWNINKYILKNISDLLFKDTRFLNNLVYTKKIEFWTLSIIGIEKCYYLFNYLDNYSLRSKKLYSYLKWKEIYYMLKDKKHLLNEENWIYINKLKREINNNKVKQKEEKD